MEFEWDEAKRQALLLKREVDFLDAMLIFENWVISRKDIRADYGEERVVSTGYADGTCYVVVHTKRGNVTRLVSAWKGGRREQRRYQESFARRSSRDEGPK